MRIALIGYGGMGNYHLGKLKSSGLYEIAGIYDNKPDKLIAAKQAGYNIYNNVESMLADKSIDAVLIATPNDYHCEYAIMFANVGKHVLCEKPVAMNLSQLERMIDAAVANKIIFMVNQNRRYDRDYLTIKNIYDNNTLGCTYKIISNVMGSHGVPGDWRKEKEHGGGMIFDWGVHLVDQALQMINSTVTSVYCRNQYVYGHEVDDGCFIILTFANGVEYHVNIETNAFISLPRWKAYGLDGSAVIKGWAVNGKILRVKTFLDNKNKGISAGNGFTKTMANRSKSTVVRSRLPKVKGDNYAIYKNFALATAGKVMPIVKHSELLRVMKVLENCFLSAEQNQVIKVEI